MINAGQGATMRAMHVKSRMAVDVTATAVFASECHVRATRSKGKHHN